jgi:hypothetical protein
MGDLVLVAAIVACFFGLTVAYVKACERIVGRDSGADVAADVSGGTTMVIGLDVAG